MRSGEEYLSVEVMEVMEAEVACGGCCPSVKSTASVIRLPYIEAGSTGQQWLVDEVWCGHHDVYFLAC